MIMDLDAMHRQVRDLMAFKAKAEPLLARLEEFLGATEQHPAAHDALAPEGSTVGPAEDHAETEQHDG
jgi:hypothetical protein